MKSVKEFKFKDLILHNFALKILAVVLAVIIWVAIVNIDNPSRTTMISGIQVVFLNEDVEDKAQREANKRKDILIRSRAAL